MKASEQFFPKNSKLLHVQCMFFPVVLLILLKNLALSLVSVDEILECDHSNDSI